MTIHVFNPANNNTGNGVCPHSTDSMWKPYVIFALDAQMAGHDERGVALAALHFRTWCQSRDIGVKELRGSYKGREEPSWIMSEVDFCEHDVWATWCSHQESILHLSATRTPVEPNAGYRIATLVYDDSREEVLGPWRCLAPELARRCDSWTFDPSGDFGGSYYVAGPVPTFGSTARPAIQVDPQELADLNAIMEPMPQVLAELVAENRRLRAQMAELQAAVAADLV